tara:strand:+ start:4984 stop:5175 length:192 start_codon:yes stop_codon:yes gene_type:complete
MKQYSIKDAAKLLGYSERHIRRLCADGTIRASYGRLPRRNQWWIDEREWQIIKKWAWAYKGTK